MQLSDSPNQALEFQSPVVEPIPRQEPTPPTVEAPAPQKPQMPVRKLLLITAFSVGAIAGGLYLHQWWQFSTTHEETDNAYITGDINPVSSRVVGTIKEVLVTDNQPVKKGQVLATLDPKDFEISLQQAKDALAVAEEQARVAQANVAVAKAGISVTANNAQGQTTQATGNIAAAQASIATAQGALAEAEAGVPAAQAQLAQVKANQIKAQLDYDRYKSLYQKGAVPKQQLDTAKAAYDALSAQVNAVEEQIKQAIARVAQAQENLSNAKAKLASTKGTLQQADATQQQTKVNQQQVEVSQRQYKTALAAIAQAKTQVRNAQQQLSYTTITAPIDGEVGNKNLEIGQRVQVGQALMVLVQKHPWIVANFKETQLGKMHTGEAVEIKLDAFPGHVFHGKVNSLSPASGAEFALLPPDNATGNFTKIVQRIPVKVTFDAASLKGYESQISPGMSAVVTVSTPKN